MHLHGASSQELQIRRKRQIEQDTGVFRILPLPLSLRQNDTNFKTLIPVREKNKKMFFDISLKLQFTPYILGK
jgi:hypothetical protein